MTPQKELRKKQELDDAYDRYPGVYPGGREAFHGDVEANERAYEVKRRTGNYPDINKPVVSAAENPYDEIQVSPDNAKYALDLNKSHSQRNYKLEPGMTGYKRPRWQQQYVGRKKKK